MRRRGLFCPATKPPPLSWRHSSDPHTPLVIKQMHMGDLVPIFFL